MPPGPNARYPVLHSAFCRVGVTIMTLSDAEIKQRILDDLSWDSSIDSSKIAVVVNHGRVTLAGTVPTFSARNRATDAAYRIADVIQVDNRIVVKYELPVPGDPEIRIAVADALTADPDMDRTDIRISVKRGVVTLEGSVDAYWKKGEAERIACRTRGICNITDKLTVVPTRSIADKTIAGDVRAAIERNINGMAGCVTVRVADGIVTLSGAVPNWAAVRAAVNAAEFTRGVIDVLDNLEIRAPAAAAGSC